MTKKTKLLIFTLSILMTIVMTSCGKQKNPVDSTNEGTEPDVSQTITDNSGLTDSNEPKEDTTAASTNVPDSESTKENKETKKYVIVDVTTKATETEESSTQTDDTVFESTQAEEPKEDDETGLDKAIRALNITTKENKSLVCYDGNGTDKTTIYVIVNEGEKAIRKEYVYYNNVTEFENDKSSFIDKNVNNETRMVFIGETEDMIVENPNDNIYVALFGYVVWKK